MSADEVQIGLVYPDSGPMASIFSVSRAGFDARFGLENSAGGVNGRQITYQWRDDEGSPDRFSLVADELLDRVGVFGLITQTTAVGESADRLDSLEVPMTGLAAEAVWSQHRN
nr:ABC transporter substrate-binding protein [Micromonospora sp. DSM 115978]